MLLHCSTFTNFLSICFIDFLLHPVSSSTDPIVLVTLLNSVCMISRSLLPQSSVSDGSSTHFSSNLSSILHSTFSSSDPGSSEDSIISPSSRLRVWSIFFPLVSFVLFWSLFTCSPLVFAPDLFHLFVLICFGCEEGSGVDSLSSSLSWLSPESFLRMLNMLADLFDQ